MDNFKLTRPSLVFDFDGTMVKLFSNYNLKKTSSHLKEVVKKYGVGFDDKLDAFDVFSVISCALSPTDTRRAEAYREADAVLTEAELEAVVTGQPVDGVAEGLTQLFEEGFNLGIATNNSAKCVSAFMSRYCPTVAIPVVGRVGERPELMKPDAWSLVTVMNKMGCVAQNTILIGDTSRDYECAVTAGCKFIGMAHSGYKFERLLKIIDAKDIVCNYRELKEKLLGISG